MVGGVSVIELDEEYFDFNELRPFLSFLYAIVNIMIPNTITPKHGAIIVSKLLSRGLLSSSETLL